MDAELGEPEDDLKKPSPEDEVPSDDEEKEEPSEDEDEEEGDEEEGDEEEGNEEKGSQEEDNEEKGCQEKEVGLAFSTGLEVEVAAYFQAQGTDVSLFLRPLLFSDISSMTNGYLLPSRPKISPTR